MQDAFQKINCQKFAGRAQTRNRMNSLVALVPSLQLVVDMVENCSNLEGRRGLSHSPISK